MKARLFLLIVASATALLTAGCKKASHSSYALTAGNRLVAFNTSDPATLTSDVTLSGLPLDSTTGQAAENIVQLAVRPSDGQLYGISSANHVFVITPGTGAVTEVASGAAFTTSTLSSPQLAVDLINDAFRIVSPSQNLLVSPDSATLLSSGTAPIYSGTSGNSTSSPSLVGIAYTYSGSGETAYALDATTQSLVTIGSAGGSPLGADSGVLYTIGSLGQSFGSSAGFAIDTSSKVGYAALAAAGGTSSLYTVNLASGAATYVKPIGDGTLTVTALALSP